MSMPFDEMSWLMLTAVIRKPLQKKYGKKAAREYIKKAKPIGRQMFLDVDNIGKGNPMAGNLYGAFPLMAIWKAADGAITPEDYAEVINEMMEQPLVKKFMSHGDMNDAADRKKLQNKFIANQTWVDEHPEYKEYTWDFNFDESKPDHGIYYHFTRCPLNTFARKYGFLEILPVMCNIDHLTAGLMHAVLYRKYTLATGGAICDYWFVGDRQID